MDALMTIKEAGVKTKAALGFYYDHREAGYITDLVLEDLTGFSRVDRILHDRDLLTAEKLSRLNCSIKLLQQKMPVQYVLGYAYFCTLRLKVNDQVLIPRPETEELADWILTTIQKESGEKTNPGQMQLLDVGTGSGCIALAVKHQLPALRVMGCDISDGALGVARHNARLTKLEASFFKLDILFEKAIERLPLLDYIVSNPPYIDHGEKVQMEAHVLDFEPHLALFPDKTLPATIFYQKISQLASKKLKPGGALFLEINPMYVKEIVEMLKSDGAVHIEIRKDLQGKDRMVKSVFKK